MTSQFPGPQSPSRRKLLAAAAGIALASGMPIWTWAVAPPASAPSITPPANTPTTFLTLSTLLMPGAQLEPRIGARLYAALLARDGGFVAQSRALLDFARGGAITDVEALAATLQLQGETVHLATMKQIIAAWYLGVVGSDAGGTVVTYELALMHQQVKDAVGVPTYCRARPGYWVKRPPQA